MRRFAAGPDICDFCGFFFVDRQSIAPHDARINRFVRLEAGNVLIRVVFELHRGPNGVPERAVDVRPNAVYLRQDRHKPGLDCARVRMRRACAAFVVGKRCAEQPLRGFAHLVDEAEQDVEFLKRAFKLRVPRHIAGLWVVL
ncbi:hypothetical protein D3C81_1699360 [compost metagenome]